MEHSLLYEIAICIVVAWVLGVGAHCLRQPLILAYLFTGFAVGPAGLGLITRQTSINTIAQLGLSLLLFMIGLEIDLRKIARAGSLIATTAALQMVGGCLLGLGLFRLCGLPLGGGQLDALYLAVAAALSSTVIIVKILYDKRELDTLAGRVTLGVLVLQDLFAILFLAVQPQLQHPTVGLLGLSLVKVAVLMVVAFLAGRFLLPPVFRTVARLPELVLVGSIAWCFLVAGLAGYLELSHEMGALVAGVAISTFPYSLDVAAKVTSLRDFFVTLFFVSLGLMIPRPTVGMVAAALGLSVFVVASRMITVLPWLHRMRQGHRVSFLPALHLSQVSEFSLVILTLGLGAQHLSKSTFDVAAYAFAFLAVASSYAMAKSDPLARRISPWLTRLGLRDSVQSPEETAAQPATQPSILLLGFSWTASSLLEELSRAEPRLLNELGVIDFNPQVNAELRRRGVAVIYGDISQRDTLAHAGVGHAEILICSLPNTVLKGTNNLRLLQQLREINPTAQIIVHAELFADIPKLYAAGASYVSVPRLIEAGDLCDAVLAARHNLLELKRAELGRKLADRREVIP